MKKTILFLILFSVIKAYASPVDSTLAKKIAVKVMQLKAKNKTSYETFPIIEKKYNGINTLYIVNFKNGGNIIVSADDRIIPVLAYSEKSSFNTNRMTKEASYWLDYYNKSIFDIISKNTYVNNSYKWDNILENKILSTEKSVQELLTTIWAQRYSYDNVVCHAFNYYVTETSDNCSCSGYCPAGCTAIAVAQIMRYWAHPVRMDNKYKWCEMPDTLTTISPNFETEKNAIARLIRDVGIEVNMDYCDDGDCGSGAGESEARSALVNHFNYDNSANIRNRFMYSDKRWKEILRENLDKGIPVFYSGWSDNKEGHSFVCDGYGYIGDDNYFHFNMGWNGSQNDFYYIDSIGSYEFHKWQQAITDIKPEVVYDCNAEINIQQYYKTYFPPLFYYPMYGTINSTLSEQQIIIENNDNVSYTSHNSIRLKNFRVNSGGTFKAQLIDCPSDCRHASPNAGKNTIVAPEKSADEINSNLCVNDSKISLYPNPAKQSVTLEINLSENQECLCSITDISGKEYYRDNFNVNKGYFTKNIDLSAMPLGIYFVNIRNNKLFETMKLIISK